MKSSDGGNQRTWHFNVTLQPTKERKCPEATDPRGAKDSIASGAIGRLDINGLYRVPAEPSPIINHQCLCRSHPCSWQSSLRD